MAFDQTTRNRLARFVSDTRALLTEEFTRQLQNEYGLDPVSGEVTPIERLTALDDRQRETARIIRETLDYYLAGNSQADAKAFQDVLDRIVREQAFTVLNRLCAIRMSEARGLVLESIAKGYQSKGFQLYARLAGSALGETGEAYRSYLFSIMDEFAVDLPILFDRFSPQGRLFPREAVLLKLLELINDPEIDPLWTEDETIGWIYQYFNTKEERKAMRDASQAPRNSRELAVRNQFFTPRYVVEFLTDNTLGRIWYEMTKGETALKDTCRYLVRQPHEIFLGEGEAVPEQSETDENLSQEELLCQPVYIPHRPLKDPREIKMLDPACGSMHFGLYAFDLFEQIYAEAWELEVRLGEDALQRLADLDPLRKTYSDKDTYFKDVPRLIIERNIHGVDIDPRAVQIAGLSLWLRAQKSWQAQGIKSGERPQIRKSNVVCAEPMPGDQQMLEEFLGTLRGDGLEALMRKAWYVPADQKVRATPQMADALCKLMRNIWQEMELAGEAGSLLKIEETLRNAIAAARKEAEDKSPLFRVLEYGLKESPNEHYVRLVAGEDQDFFDKAEGLVLAALKDYSEQAVNGSSFRRRLFAGDAVQGFAFIDLCRKYYDTVLMNPPFGEPASSTQDYLQLNYPSYCGNILCAFIQNSTLRLIKDGVLGAIYDRTVLSKVSYEDFRQNCLLPDNRLYLLGDLGWGVLDANVETTTSVISLNNINRSLFIDLRKFNVEQKGEELQIIKETIADGIKHEELSTDYAINFQRIPNMVIAYDMSDPIRQLFIKSKSLQLNNAYAVVGHQFKSDEHMRLWWEIDNSQLENDEWVRMYNGSSYSRYYLPLVEVVKWGKNGNSVRFHPSVYLRNSQYQKKPGVGYGKRGEFVDTQIIPSGFFYTNEGQCIIIEKIEDAWVYLGLTNSALFSYIINLYCGQHCEGVSTWYTVYESGI